MSGQNILIVEDNFLNRRLIKKVLSEKGYQILECKNSREALSIIEKRQVDLIILDINLGENELNGISLGQIIKDKYAIPFIYLTAYETSDIINQAIVTKPCSYITKPFKNIDLIVSVEIALHQKKVEHSPKTHYIVVRDNEYNIKLPVDDIDYLESEGNYILIHSSENAFRYRSTIKQILEILPEDQFIQTHRAFVVNKNKIDKFSNKELIVKNINIPVSKKFNILIKPTQDTFEE